MWNKEPALDDGEVEYEAGPKSCWGNFEDDGVMQQQFSIQDDEAKKFPFVGDKEPLSSLAAEYQSGSTQGDGNCFFRGFMFSYLEHVFGFLLFFLRVIVMRDFSTLDAKGFHQEKSDKAYALQF
ncbi:unnamed protein product [Trifolium pratense]|uniref:Uncharacterized protein n=1 Tax=Trifolium pratense TaxID=57577 RepID=A0ACB0JJB5_TRIPR|nr:unnamed protein product [Trifolium pratense]